MKKGERQQRKRKRKRRTRETYVSGRQEHLDEHVKQVGSRAVRSLPVDGPLVDDASDEVTENRLHEEDLGEKLGPDQLGTLEVEVVEDLEADGEGHLQVEGGKSVSTGGEKEERAEDERG